MWSTKQAGAVPLDCSGPRSRSASFRRPVLEADGEDADSPVIVIVGIASKHVKRSRSTMVLQ